jgi:hypothetical protein
MSALVVLLLVLTTCGMAQAKMEYYDKSKCTREGVWFRGGWSCDVGKIACCGPSNDKCYAEIGVLEFRCKPGDKSGNCCDV